MTNPDHESHDVLGPVFPGPTPDPAPGPAFQGVISVIATAHAVHPEGADLSELPGFTPDAGTDETENH